MELNDHCDQEPRPSIGAVRGRNVYELTRRRHLVTGPSNSLDSAIQQRFVHPASPYRVRAHLAELHATAGGGYELLIPASGTKKAVRVRIDFETKPTLMGGIHGSEQGPAQYELTRVRSGWKARIEVNETLHRRDLPFIIGHELDEIAIIVRTNPPDDATILAEGWANLFEPGSTSAPRPQVTAHDCAAARELCALWEDYQHPPRGTDRTGRTKREGRLERMLSAMGLRKSTTCSRLFDKFRVLRAKGAKDTLLRKIGVPGEPQRYLANPKFRALQTHLLLLKSLGSIVNESLISHLMIPLDPGRRPFLNVGINGGHHDKWLHDFVDSHPRIVIVKEAEKVVQGIVYRKYSQYRWKGSGPKPESDDSRFPKPGDAVASTFNVHWELAKQGGMPLPKTTFSSLHDFLLAVDEAWLGWQVANPLLTHNDDEEFTHFSTFAGIQVTGFFEYIEPDQFTIQTAYVEALWF